MQILIIDNYDSFTYNLYQMVGEISGVEPLVVPNDRCDWTELSRSGIDAVIISPGPGLPDRPGDFGICTRIIRECRVPVLGVCLGHQGIAAAFGGSLTRAACPMHGRPSAIRHSGAGLFENIPQDFTAIRYHSWVVANVPPCLEVTAWTADGVVMALAHRDLPIFGLQFHPESICTEHGLAILRNFVAIASEASAAPGVHASISPGIQASPDHNASDRAALARQPARLSLSPTGPGATAIALDGSAASVLHPYDRIAATREYDQQAYSTPPLRRHAVHWRKVPYRNPEAVFLALYADAPVSFWLDSSAPDGDAARFSYMGDASGPASFMVTYDAPDRRITVRSGSGTETHHGSVLDFLAETTAERTAHADDLPFDFISGFVGYLGFEARADCGYDCKHASPTPDAAFLFADRFVAFDHEDRAITLVALTEDGAPDPNAWFTDAEARIARAADAPPPPAVAIDGFHLNLPAERYLADIRACQKEIVDGETYEVCLTARFSAPNNDADPLDAYRLLRRANPAPRAAYLRFGAMAILCSSPERFLRVTTDGMVETKPIKGTARRSATHDQDRALRDALEHSEKDRSEHLMIVDLMRNDLGRVCEIGSVHVPALMAIESYATVHQMVSTIQGRLKTGYTVADCIRSAFPPGSMTGAPKRRTIEIIETLEGEARGIYSGTLGYLSVNGSADLNVIIRTAVIHDGRISIGTGGAIVHLSDPAEELREIALKANAVIRALGSHADLTCD
jgi:para-aminobenzoate synthetase